MSGRGLKTYVTFETAYGHTIRIQQSSNACYDGTWLYIKKEDEKEPCDIGINLTENQLKILIAGLQDRLDDIEH